MRHFYYYVPPCPKCGSRRTGRYLKTPLSGAGYMKEKSLKMGELIRFASFEPHKNAFCEDCGYEWPCVVETKYWTNEQIRAEQTARQTEGQYNRFMEKKREAEMGRKKGGLFGWLSGSSAEVYTGDTSYDEEYVSPSGSTIIDRRRQKEIEIIYADEALIAKVLNNQAENF